MAPWHALSQSWSTSAAVCDMQIADGIAGFKDERPRILMVSSAAVERNAIIGDDLGTHLLHSLSPCICHEVLHSLQLHVVCHGSQCSKVPGAILSCCV